MPLQKSESRIPGGFDLVHANHLGYSNLDEDFCMISHLPQTIRVVDLYERFTNHYVIFVNDTPGNTYTYAWTFEYKNTQQQDDPNAIIRTYTESRPAFQKGVYELDSIAQGLTAVQHIELMQLTVKCTVSGPKGTANLELNHYFTDPYRELEAFYNDNDDNSPIAKGGAPHTTQLVANIYREFFPYGPQWNYQDFTIPMNLPVAILYSRIAELGTARTHYPPNTAYYEGVNNTTLTLAKKDRDNVIGTAALKPHFLSMLMEKSTYKRIGNDNGTKIEESEIFTDFGNIHVNDGIDLYNYARFPKSGILLSALFLQDLFDRAQTNDCLNFKGSSSDQATWKSLSATEIKDHLKLAKNLFDEYVEGPQVEVKNFNYKRTIGKPHLHDWSPYVEEILDYDVLTKADAPRVINAYFAKKVVTDHGGGALSVALEEIDTRIYGRECYLVIETQNLRGRDLICNVITDDDVYTGAEGDKIDFLEGLVQKHDFVTTVGLTTVFENNDEINPYNNMTDFADKAIVKIALRPELRFIFNIHASHIHTNPSQAAALGLRVQPVDNEVLVYYGAVKDEEDLVNTPHDFTPGFTLTTKRFYEIYHHDTDYNSIYNAPNQFISKLENEIVGIDEAAYFYFDELDNEHDFGTFTIHQTRRWIRKGTLSTDPNDLVELIDVNQFAGYNDGTLQVAFATNNSPRDFVNPEGFAGLIGAMAVQSINDLGFNGFSNADGNPGVSATHLNGLAGDLRPLRTDRTGALCLLTYAQFDLARQNAFHDSLFAYGWARTANMYSENFIPHGSPSGTPQMILNHCQHLSTPRHNNHLHMRGFDATMVTILNPNP